MGYGLTLSSREMIELKVPLPGDFQHLVGTVMRVNSCIEACWPLGNTNLFDADETIPITGEEVRDIPKGAAYFLTIDHKTLRPF